MGKGDKYKEYMDFNKFIRFQDCVCARGKLYVEIDVIIRDEIFLFSQMDLGIMLKVDRNMI